MNILPLFNQGTQSEIWPFIRGLRWLRPISRTTIDQLERDFPAHTSQQWLQRSLLAHDLSAQLIVLVNSRQHLLQHYYGKFSQLCVKCFVFASSCLFRSISTDHSSVGCAMYGSGCSRCVSVSFKLCALVFLCMPVVSAPSYISEHV